MPAETAFYYKEFLIVLGVAGLAVPLYLRLGVNAVLAFLIMGVLLSPDILGNLAHHVPALSMLNIADPESLSHIAELGVVFLLFVIGLELKPSRLWQMRRDIFGLGSAQVLLTGGIGTVSEVVDGVYTGNLAGPFCYGEGKVDKEVAIKVDVKAKK